MRLNKYISSTGYCSRREADKLIEKELVKINGKLASLGDTVEDTDKVEVEEKLIEQKNEFIYIALNKPRGIICTTEKHIKDNIIDFIDYNERIFPVGRLDRDSEGLIILTNDGDIVNKILRYSNNHEKEYEVMVDKNITDNFLKNLEDGVEIYNPVKNEYIKTYKAKVRKLSDRRFRIIISQGLNKQIRRMCSKFNYRVYNLKRVRIDRIRLDGLAVGKWRYLTEKELKNIY